MSIDAIAALGAASLAEAPASAIPSPRADFGAVVERGVASANEALHAADQNVRLLASGQEIATHDVMISLEDARMQLMLLSEVRNRVVEAYQELSRMQL
ncbi:flagellar hook-basal body complex protein FliE [Pseudoxanthomonas sp. PXM02]|uniref:flagellar hook-basal body complex protein FliE n=1 Tax=Pseudoxanthomonas sp. PXM02 TaxID=2769294 RepID=UPI001787174E|nr:flagellar hook-basal body complex protein FliE [Pseudoxanthomonas sp. PXM02]MBD9477423.1 flagellar hook-basal body complex protein FliE [Pseudoxanthomonas sp. PXM02]